MVQPALVAADRVRRLDRRRGGGEGSAQHAVGGAVHRPLPRHHRDASAKASPGLPIWVGVQHFFNLFLLIFIIRSGLQILSDHPRLYWTRHSTPGKDWFRIQKPVPSDPLWTAKQDSISLPRQVGLPGLRHSIGLARWWHLGIDSLWLLNGLVFYVLLFTTGQWRRVVPTTWAVFPNALSVLDPVPFVALADRERMGRVQQSSAARLLHHDLRCRTARAHHRARHVTCALDPLQAGEQAAEHPDGTISALPRAGLVPACSS